MDDRDSRPGLALRGEPKRLRIPDLAGEMGAAGAELGTFFSCRDLRMCGSRRMSRERENSKLGCSTLKQMSRFFSTGWEHVQRKLLIDLCAVRKNGERRMNIVDSVVQCDAEHRFLFGYGYRQALNAEHCEF